MIVPLYSYSHDRRYSQFADFLIRTKNIGRNDKITRSQFIQKCGLLNRTARDVWRKGIFVCEYFRGIDGETVYLRTKQTTVVCEISPALIKEIKSLPDFKLFVTAIQAGKLNEYGNRSRTLRTIGKQTGTVYKNTVSRRIHRAKKIGLNVKERFIQCGEFTPQISNSYGLPGVTFLYNKFCTPNLLLNSQSANVARAEKKKAIRVEIVKKGHKPPTDFYSMNTYVFSMA